MGVIETDGGNQVLKEWDENGNVIRERNYKDGKRDGLNREWDQNGQLLSEVTIKEGKLISVKEWDEDGNPK